MYNHEPQNYNCPFCLLTKGIENDRVYSGQDDIIYRDGSLTAFIASHWWPNNRGHVIIVPNQHIENIYDLPDEISHAVHDLEKKIALALKDTYNCDGVSSRQHIEPSGGQDVWHYHLHVFPRYEDDKLYLLDKERYLSNPEERLTFANKLKAYLKK